MPTLIRKELRMKGGVETKVLVLCEDTIDFYQDEGSPHGLPPNGNTHWQSTSVETAVRTDPSFGTICAAAYFRADRSPRAEGNPPSSLSVAFPQKTQRRFGRPCDRR